MEDYKPRKRRIEMFFDTTYEKKNTYNKPNFLSLTLGKHITRILGNPLKVFIHWLPTQRTTVRCLGDDCVICRNNKMIMIEHPEDFRNQPNFYSKQPRHLMNVLDRTPAKICPNCQTENKILPNNTFSVTCTSPECGALLTGVEAMVLDKVKVLGISNTNAETLNNMSSTQMNEKGELLSITDYDIVWIVSKGNGTRHVLSAFPGTKDIVIVSPEFMFDLTKVTLVLTNEEIQEVLKGVSLKDIFLARKEESKEKVEENTNEQKAVDDIVSSLFNS